MNYDFRTNPPFLPSLKTALAHIAGAQLVRQVTDTDTAYLFKHALIQDSAYSSLTRHERKRLHRLVGQALESFYRNTLHEQAALLGFHFEHAEEWTQALYYLELAAENARHAAAHREQLDLLARAIAIAERLDMRESLAKLHLQRGKAFGSITRFADQRRELEQALAYADEGNVALRADILVSLAIAAQWLQDHRRAFQEAQQARTLGELAGRADLVAIAMSTQAFLESTSGDVRASVIHFDQAFALAGDLQSSSLLQGMEVAGLSQYWLGNLSAALERTRRAVELAQRAGDTVTIMRGLSNLGMTLWSMGKFAEAMQTFIQARAFGEAHALGAWLARQIAIEGGFHLELYDYAGAEELAKQARAMAVTYKFIVATVSPGVDLLFTYARTGRIQEALMIESEINDQLPAVTGAHTWLIGLRFVQARAELAVEQRDWKRALTLANQALELSRTQGRVKYEALNLQTRARVLKQLGHLEQAVEDARTAVELARPSQNPAMFVRAALTQLELQPNDTLAAEARAVARHIRESLPDPVLSSRFEAFISEWI